jgi:hypothetical protein
MARPCTFCKSEKRAELEQALLSGEITQAEAAKILKRNQAQISRHMRSHLPAHLKPVVAEPLGLNIISQLVDMNRQTREILAEAREDGDNRLALRAIERAESQLELQAKLLGKIDSSPKINIVLSSEWQRLRAIILSVLEPYPEARKALSAALLEVENASD